MGYVPSAERRRVVWAAGDPTHRREAWAKEARAYASLRKRPVACQLIAALAPYIHRHDGYAWVSDETLRIDMGCKHRSAVSRAIEIADRELGLIDRETEVIPGEGGRVAGARRRIFPARPSDMSAVLATVQRRTMMPKAAAPRDTPSIRGRAGRRPNSPRPVSEPVSEPLGQDTGLDYLTEKNRYTVSVFSDSGEVATGRLAVSRQLSKLMEDASHVDFTDTTPNNVHALNEIGRAFFPSAKKGEIPLAEIVEARHHLQDAARRAWCDGEPKILRMLAAFDDITQPRMGECRGGVR